MFNVGDRVTSKKTGLPMMGSIAAIFDPKYYISLTRITKAPAWDKLYPNWREEIVILVRSDSPQRHLSFDEFKELNSNIPDDMYQYEYENIPSTLFMYYVRDDLELIEVENIIPK